MADIKYKFEQPEKQTKNSLLRTNTETLNPFIILMTLEQGPRIKILLNRHRTKMEGLMYAMFSSASVSTGLYIFS